MDTGNKYDSDALVGQGLFASRLEELFRTVPGPNGRAFTAKAIAQRSTALGFRLGESYLSQLRSGKAKSPSFRTVEGISAAWRTWAADPDGTLEQIEESGQLMVKFGFISNDPDISKLYWEGQ